MKQLIVIVLAAVVLSGCNLKGQSANSGFGSRAPGTLTNDEKHRLYTAALMASDSPLDSEVFKQACQRIGIMDAGGNPNGNYMAFVREHLDWGLKSETEQFRLEINTKDKAAQYAKAHLLLR